MTLVRTSVRWLTRVLVGLGLMTAVVVAIGLLLPKPWYAREAGRAPSPFATVRTIGTGFFVGPGGWILTNHHVVSGCRRVSVGNGVLLGVVADEVVTPRDDGLDLAAVHVATSPATWLQLAPTPWPSGATTRAAVGSDIEAMLAKTGRAVSIFGFPGSDHGSAPRRLAAALEPVATSADGRHWYGRLRSPVRPGWSGSPILDGKGEAIGIVFAALGDLPVGSTAKQLRALRAGLSTSAAEAMFIPAGLLQPFVASLTTGADGAGATAKPADTTVVRVFCFR